MKIRNKLLIFAMVASLLPMVLVAGLNRLAMRRIESDVSARAYAALSEDAREYLLAIVDDYGRIMRREGVAVALALQYQVQSAEASLAQPPADPKAPLLTSEDFQRRDPRIGPLVTGEDYIRYDAGRVLPMHVSMNHADIHLPPGMSRGDLSPARERQCQQLLSMIPDYRRIRLIHPGVFTWQYTTLTNGLHVAYPGTGDYPEGYDALKREWYRGALAKADDPDPSYWTRYRDALTEQVVMTASQAFRGPDGKVAGVTGLDVALSKVINLLRLPEDWRDEAAVFVVFPEPGPEGTVRLPIFYPYPPPADPGDLDTQEPDAFRLASSAEHRKLLGGIASMQAGVFETTWQGRPALCAYGEAPPDQPVPVVIVPRDVVLAEGLSTVRQIRERTNQALLGTAAALGVVVLLVVLGAVRQSRSVSRPILRLADAGRNLAAGDYETHVDISVRSGDELAELGGVFNAIGPQLEERQEIKHSLTVAREIQQHLLPLDVPERAGLELAACGLYCDETGGDYYDFIELHDPNRLGLAIGDITGHGIAAALLMASARAVLRSHATQYDTKLAEMFADLNRHLVRDTGDERFLTLFYGVLEAGSRKLWYASGGHDPAVWCRAATGSVELLDNTGPLMGAIEGLTFEQAGPVTLEPGDVLAVGTDGIWEARNPAGELFERERFVRTLVENAHRHPDDIIQAIIHAVRDFADGHPQEDDITLIVVKAVDS
jgi:phosphoserine phosphatase RsbU/P